MKLRRDLSILPVKEFGVQTIIGVHVTECLVFMLKMLIFVKIEMDDNI